MKDYIKELLSYLTIIPSAAICYFPMKNQLRYGKRKTAAFIVPFFLITLPPAAFLGAYFTMLTAFIPIPLLALYFVVYKKTVNADLSQALAVFMTVCAAVAFPGNFANAYDAILHPGSNSFIFSSEAAIFRLVLTSLLMAALYVPFSKYGSRIVDSFAIKKVWNIITLISCIFLGYNLLIMPHKYSTLYVNNVFLFFVISLFMLFVLLILLLVIFYHIVNGMMTAAKTRERNRILEMQESQYLKLRNYIDQTAKARHDFKHAIRTLTTLAENNDFAAVSEYLKRYSGSLPEKDVVFYCKNNAVNALLNYYMHAAKAEDIALSWDIDLPEVTGINDIDLCSIIGNILENAVAACYPIEKGKFIQLSVTRHHDSLYIVATNSFGEVLKQGDTYLSTHKNGNGIGIESINTTAERYDGFAEFSNDEKFFYTNVVLKIKE